MAAKVVRRVLHTAGGPYNALHYRSTDWYAWLPNMFLIWCGVFMLRLTSPWYLQGATVSGLVYHAGNANAKGCPGEAATSGSRQHAADSMTALMLQRSRVSRPRMMAPVRPCTTHEVLAPAPRCWGLTCQFTWQWTTRIGPSWSR